MSQLMRACIRVIALLAPTQTPIGCQTVLISRNDSIRAGAENADAVIHLANKHDFTNPAVSNAAERGAVQTIGDALVGSDRPFLLASGVAAITPGRPSNEGDPSPFHGPGSPRGGSENLALAYVDRGVRTVSAPPS